MGHGPWAKVNGSGESRVLALRDVDLDIRQGIWSLIGGGAAFFWGVPQDWLLLVSGVIAVPLMIARRRNPNLEG
ncbi:DUF6064 family protein [Mesorhizobium jarvisii]|uniref:DUF6064 family protein n=1 Tax=Mesorhizobium jarvisii TaxID=1777867 RepID=UPI001F0AF582|nr:DUF6064 family protein [Mesorhizobium jarvisii]MCH4559175.1 DUF6064 family protein [Mesorhizobium jarvisii]